MGIMDAFALKPDAGTHPSRRPKTRKASGYMYGRASASFKAGEPQLTSTDWKIVGQKKATQATLEDATARDAAEGGAH